MSYENRKGTLILKVTRARAQALAATLPALIEMRKALSALETPEEKNPLTAHLLNLVLQDVQDYLIEVDMGEPTQWDNEKQQLLEIRKAKEAA